MVPARSQRKAVGQGLLLLAIGLWWMLLDALNRDVHAPLSGAALLAPVWIAAIALAYALRSPYALAAGLLTLGMWLPEQITVWRGSTDDIARASALGLLALLVYAVGRLHVGRVANRDFADLYSVAGAAVLALMFLSLSSHQLIDALGSSSSPAPPGAWRAAALVDVVAMALVTATAWALIARALGAAESGGILVLTATLLTLPYLHAGLPVTVMLNVLAGVVCLAPLFVGYARRDVNLLNLGAGLAFVLIGVKYFDWFYSYLGRSLFFLTAGALLLSVGWLMERGRRRVIRWRMEA